MERSATAACRCSAPIGAAALYCNNCGADRATGQRKWFVGLVGGLTAWLISTAAVALILRPSEPWHMRAPVASLPTVASSPRPGQERAPTAVPAEGSASPVAGREPSRVAAPLDDRAEAPVRGELNPAAGSIPFGGTFRDEKSQEVLVIASASNSITDSVVYRGSGSKPKQTLTILSQDAATGVLVVRFRRSPEQYLLTYARDRASITCKNPDGTLQTFGRVGQGPD